MNKKEARQIIRTELEPFRAKPYSELVQMVNAEPITGERIGATGRKVKVSGINVYVIEEGRIAQEWEQMDSLGVLAQLGVLPPPTSQGSQSPNKAGDGTWNSILSLIWQTIYF